MTETVATSAASGRGPMRAVVPGGVDEADPLPGWLSSAVSADTEQSFRRVESKMRDQLTDRAAAEGVVDVGYDVVSTPLGDLLLACTDEGLARVAFPGEDHDRVLALLAVRLGPRMLRAPRLVAAAADQIVSYLEGRRTHFDLAVDLRLATGFRRAVLDVLQQLPRGATRSYAEVAQAAGHPRAIRAVGSACATNPVPIVVPCHRVLRSDGSLGGYVGGLAVKRWLLDLEAAA
jgi:methylated-DNA-[protein]-cysteine S-methyltransferase